MEASHVRSKEKNESCPIVVMRIRSFLNKKAMLTLYHSLMLSHVRYCVVNWCFGNETIVGQLQRICNKFIRIIFGLNRRSSVKDVMIENGLLTIKQIRDLEICIFMYKYLNQCLPAALQNLFSIKATRITTRSNSKYISASYRATVCEQSIKFLRPKIWNKLPTIIKESKSLRSFASKAKAHLISK